MPGVEDEVDWSDGELNPPHPQAPFDRVQRPIHTMEEASPTTSTVRSPTDKPFETLPPYLRSSVDGPSGLPKVVCGTASQTVTPQKRPIQLTKEVLSNFALYQANQKTYEAAYLKAFVSHALRTDTLDLKKYLCGKPDALAEMEAYMQSVSDNINQLTDKMIWNAHSKTINMLAPDAQRRIPFVDVDHFSNDLFSDFGPHNTYSAVTGMNQSWHRTNIRQGMVAYSAHDYSIESKKGPVRSPFDELQEAARALQYNPKSAELPRGRVFRSIPEEPSRSRPSNASQHNGHITKSPVNASPQETKGNIFSSIGRFTNPPSDNKASEKARKKQTRLPTSTSTKSSPTRRKAVQGRDKRRPPSAFAKKSSSVRQILHEVHNDVLGHRRTRPNAHVARSVPVSIICNVDTIAGAEQSPPAPNKNVQWQAQLIEDHKARLAQKTLVQQQHPQRLLQDTKSIIETAVAANILKPPSGEVQRLIDAHASKETGKLQQSSHVETGPTRRPVPTVKSKGKRKSNATGGLPNKKPHKGSATRASAASPRNAKIANANKPEGNPSRPAKRVDTEQKTEAKAPPRPHPSGSKTLELHQVLPPDAYFEKVDDDEKPVWRCGIRHPLGYYYNAGDRRQCPGCNTNVDHNPQAKVMDFYMPSRAYFYQEAPGVVWKPLKPLANPRKCNSLSHNGFAKDVFWQAKEDGYDSDIAREMAVEALKDHLKPKPKPEPEPSPEPEPEPADLGPHPSGSTTMEHGQNIPGCHYFEQAEPGEQFAWRCDIAHALGRYYMAGDRKSCPGCGSNRGGAGKQATMDFYLPPSVVVRQEAPGFIQWKPRKPYRLKNPSKKTKQLVSHNQICAANYWRNIDNGMEPEEALATATKDTDESLAVKEEEHSDSDDSEESEKEDPQEKSQKEDAPVSDADANGSDVEMGENDEEGEGDKNEEEEARTQEDPGQEDVAMVSSDDDDVPSSGSDSE